MILFVKHISQIISQVYSVDYMCAKTGKSWISTWGWSLLKPEFSTTHPGTTDDIIMIKCATGIGAVPMNK